MGLRNGVMIKSQQNGLFTFSDEAKRGETLHHMQWMSTEAQKGNEFNHKKSEQV